MRRSKTRSIFHQGTAYSASSASSSSKTSSSRCLAMTHFDASSLDSGNLWIECRIVCTDTPCYRHFRKMSNRKQQLIRSLNNRWINIMWNRICSRAEICILEHGNWELMVVLEFDCFCWWSATVIQHLASIIWSYFYCTPILSLCLYMW